MNQPPRINKLNLGKIPLHPVILAIYFILALLGLNISQALPVEAARVLVITLGSTLILLLVLRVVLKDWLLGSYLTSLLLILFFTYGHVYNLLEKSVPLLGRHRLLIPIWLLLAAAGIWVITRRLKKLVSLNSALNIIALFLLLFPLFQIVRWEIGTHQVREQPVKVADLRPVANRPPDVYFFIVDMYARQDVLKDVYNFDNSAFLAELRKMGFNLVECSQSNYSQTEMVLTSILNMNYLDKLGQFDPSTTDALALRNLIKHNLVMQTFRDMGYKLVSFESGFHFSEFYDADYYLTPNSANANLFGRMNTFELMLIKSTAALVLFDSTKALPAFLSSGAQQPLETKRQQALFEMDKLESMPGSISGPKFVFVHNLVLHEPFAFSADGKAMSYPETMDEEQYQAGYRDQLVYLNSRLLPILHKLIDDSDPKPIIILQGDTGPGIVSHAGRMAQLSAFYLPGYDQSLSPTLTPVNDFRLVFDRYYGAKLELLPDYSYFSLYTSPFDLEPVSNECIADQ